MSSRTAAVAIVLAAGFVAPAGAQDGKQDSKKDIANPSIPCTAIASIGTAQMSADGVITLKLGSLWPNPMAEGELSYAPDDPQYDEIKRHLGGMAPGDVKPVKPWC